MQRSVVELIRAALCRWFFHFTKAHDFTRLKRAKPIAMNTAPIRMKGFLVLKPIAINAIPRAMKG
jgi:hypothetical protein